MKKHFFYFASTHWDREWYKPFEFFRGFLAENAEKIAETLEKNTEFRFFCFDGQTIVLEDVEEINPALAERLKKLIRAGRLLIGPWYVMPDELLVSGESVIRNFLRGFRIARGCGAEPWKAGYACDVFGHIGQLPQILSGFGIQTAVVWRGVDEDLPAFLRWKAPDGTSCNTLHLHDYGVFSSFFRSKDFPDDFSDCFRKLQDFYGNDVILSDALDHVVICEDAPEKLKKLKEKFPERDVCWTDFITLPAFRKKNLPEISGEQIFPAKERSLQIAHTLSSRYDLKKENDLLRNQIELETEPVSVFLGNSFSASYKGMLELAWKNILRNHPHDSICGCSVDAVHQRMHGRSLDASAICDFMKSHLIVQDRIAHTREPDGGLKADPAGKYLLRVFNTLPFERNGIAELDLVFPDDFPKSFGEPRSLELRNAFRILDLQGKEIPYSVVSVLRSTEELQYKQSFWLKYNIHRIRLSLKLAPLSWNTFHIVPAEQNVRFFGTLRTGLHSAENKFLRLTLRENGTFDIFEKRSRKTYSGLNHFVIDRESGDGWCHVSPDCSTEVIGSSRAQIECVLDTFEETRFRITRFYRLPKEIIAKAGNKGGFSGFMPASEEVEFRILTDLTLEKDSNLVKIQMIIPQMLRDARIRLVLPTNMEGPWFAGQAFSVVEREPGRTLRKRTESFRECEQLEKNFDRFVGKSSEKGSVAFLSAAGLHEAAGLPGERGELFITLCRSFFRTVATAGENDGELQNRKLVFDGAYAFLPGKADYAALEKSSQELRTAPISHMMAMNAVSRKVTPEKPPVVLSGNLAFSALKRAEDGDGIILRVVNLSGQPQKGVFAFPGKKTVCPCNLLEESTKTSSTCRSVELELPPWKIASFRMK